MPTFWIHGGTIPPCLCGAPTEDQVRRPDGGAMAHWHCLICEQGRPIDRGWVDELVPISDEAWRARNRAMVARAQLRWRERDCDGTAK